MVKLGRGLHFVGLLLNKRMSRHAKGYIDITFQVKTKDLTGTTFLGQAYTYDSELLNSNQMVRQ